MTRRSSFGKPKWTTLNYKSHHIRRWHLNNPWCQPLLTLNYAAVMIQKVVRGHATRHQTLKNVIYKRPKETSVTRNQLDKYLSRLDYYKITKKPRPDWIDDGYSSWCAVTIQSFWRMRLCNQRYLRGRMMIYQIASLTIQSAWKLCLFRRQRRIQSSISSEDSAALMIQACWRSFCCRRIFKYFSDLICVKLKGAPADLLKSIVPNESSFLDFASGTHVRFRLGGHTFPPNVYFKIYTHRPLCDVNSFAPRDYDKEKKQKNGMQMAMTKTGETKGSGGSGADLHTGVRVGSKYFGAVVSTTVGMDKWYKREEGNEWRPIASSIMNELLVPPWSRDSIAHPLKKKVDPFHFSRLRRKADVAAEKRRRKREWMTKAYRIAKGDQDPDEEGYYRHSDAVHQASSSSGHLYSRNESRRGEEEDDEDEGLRTLPQDESSRVRVRFSNPHLASTESMKSRADTHGMRLDDCSSRVDRWSGKRQEEPDNDRQQSYGEQYRRHEVSRYCQDDEDEDEENVNSNYFNSNSEVLQERNSRSGGDRADVFGDDAEMLKWSLALNFDEYETDWRNLGTSLPSDALRKRVTQGDTFGMSSC